MATVWLPILVAVISVAYCGAQEVRQVREDKSPCTNIKLPEIQQFTKIRNADNDVIGYRLLLQQNDVTVVPTWHRFHHIPEVRSHEFNYPLPKNDPDFQIEIKYELGTMETSVQMTSQYDNTSYGLQLDMTSNCGPISIYIKPHMPEFENVTSFPTITRKTPSVGKIPAICEGLTVHLEQVTSFDGKVDGRAGLTQILAKKVGINVMEETYEALEFNPDPNSKYELENIETDTGEVARQTWRIEDIHASNYIGLYQFYLTMDSQKPQFNQADPIVYMLGIPFVIKPDNFEAISIGILPCYPFRISPLDGTEDTPVKRLGFVEGYRPCFRVLTQSSEALKLKLIPYEDDVLNPLPTYSGPDVGGMREHWYVLDNDRVPQRINEYMLQVQTTDFVFIVPFVLTKYLPAQPVITVERVPGKGKILTCKTVGYPEPDTLLFEMKRYDTLGGDTHWDLERILKRFKYPLKSEEIYHNYDNVTEITTRAFEMLITPELEERLEKLTFNKAMPMGIACVTWNEYSHNIAFWSPVKKEEPKETETEKEIEITATKDEEEIASEDVMPDRVNNGTEDVIVTKVEEEVASEDEMPENENGLEHVPEFTEKTVENEEEEELAEVEVQERLLEELASHDNPQEKR